MALTDRGPTTLVATCGALAAGISGTVLEAAPVASVGWSALAAVAITLMLRGAGIRVVGVLLVLLGTAGLAVAMGSAPWTTVWFALVIAAGAVMAWKGAAWRRERQRRESKQDLWTAMDAGEDPTED